MTDKKNNFAKDINVPRKEQIIIDGVTYYKQQDINEGLDEEHYITEFHLLATHYNLLLEDYARKTQECEQKEKELKELKRQYKLSCLDCEYKNTKTDADRYRRALEEIEEIVNEPCVADAQEDCKHCDIWCEHKDILDIISRAKGR